MYVDDLGQIVEVVPFSLPSPGLALSFCPGLILRNALIDAPLSHLPSPGYIPDFLGRECSHQSWLHTPLLSPQLFHRVTWPPWLPRGSLRVFEAVTGLCLETSSKSMSGIESEWWSPKSKGEGHMSGFLCVPLLGLLLPEECLDRLHGEHHKGRQP